MKTAIMISGMLRYKNECLPSLIENIIEPLGADVYIDCWKDITIHKNDDPSEDVKFSLSEDDLKDIPNLKSFRIEDNKKISPLDNGEACAIHTMEMFYKIQKCYELLEESNAQYDVLVRARMDLNYKKKLDINLVNSRLTDRNVVFPDFNIFGGINDQFFLGKRDIMKFVCGKLFDNVEEYYKSGVKFHPETLLRHHLEKNGIEKNFCEFIYYKVQRENREE